MARAKEHGIGATRVPVAAAFHSEMMAPAAIVSQVECIMRAGHIDVGGVEYLIDARDGRLYFYDINATSNFVADATAVLGFDPFPPFVDYIARIARQGQRPGA